MCAARVARAGECDEADDVVVLSGWARSRGTRSEAELMRAAWRGAAGEVVVDPDARTTVENMANAVNDVLRVGARGGRSSSRRVARAARDRGAPLVRCARPASACAPRPARGRSWRAALRELPLWPLLPFQLWLAGRKAWKP